MSLSGKFVGLDDFGKKITDMAKKMNTSTLTNKIGKSLKSSTTSKINKGEFNGQKKLSNLTLNNRRGGGTPLKDSGQLMKSFEAVTTPSEVIIGSKLPYARLVTKGGVVKPKKAKALCIPADKEVATLVRQGISVSGVIEQYKASGWSVFRPKGRDVILARRGKGKRDIKIETKVLFILRKSVTLPARNPLFVSGEDEKMIMKLTNEFFKDILK